MTTRYLVSLTSAFAAVALLASVAGIASASPNDKVAYHGSRTHMEADSYYYHGVHHDSDDHECHISKKQPDDDADDRSESPGREHGEHGERMHR